MDLRKTVRAQAVDRQKRRRISPLPTGQGLVEYGLLVVLVAVVAIGGLVLAGGGISSIYQDVLDALLGDATPVAQPTSQPKTGADVTVQTVDDWGNPLPWVSVMVYLDNKDHYTNLNGNSGENGAVTFPDLPAGSYLFRADYGGDVHWSQAVIVPDQNSVTIQINLCGSISLGEVTFPSSGIATDGLQVKVRVEGGYKDVTIESVTIDWAYLDSLPKEKGGNMRLYGVYLCPGTQPNCYEQGRFFNIIDYDKNWKSKLNDKKSPTTVSDLSQNMPTSGGYLGFDFDSHNYMEYRSLADSPWFVKSGDFGFTLNIRECPNPVTKSATAR